jgi:hypothetical protein
MNKRTKRRRQRRRRTQKRRVGGDYRQYTDETVGGVPVTHDATVSVMGKGLLSLKEFKALQQML